MGEVIVVDFKQKTKNLPSPIHPELYNGFCEILRNKGLCEDDILDVIDGIQDIRAYMELDKDLKHIVDVYHNCTYGI
jgi:hypothetical protein